MTYGKLKDGALVYAPRNITVEGITYIPGTEEVYINAGYKPVEEMPYPSDGNIYRHSWTETSDKIEGVWILERELTPKEKRELAYRTEKVCAYEGEEYTCDEMEGFYYQYFAEDGKEDKCSEIKAIITSGKLYIREKYPDTQIFGWGGDIQ